MIAACDPGVSGAIALFGDDGKLSFVADMPLIRFVGWKHQVADSEELRATMRGCSIVVVETITPLAAGGTATAAASGASWGAVLASAPAGTVRLVHPSVWTKALGVGSDKNVHRQAAKGLFGGDWFDRKRDDGRADAALIGWWWLTKGRPGA